MTDFTQMDRMERELSQHRSAAALQYLIECGRELEFEAGGRSCFLSRYETAKSVSLWVDGKEQSFSSMEELMENARIGDAAFAEAWSSSRLITLF